MIKVIFVLVGLFGLALASEAPVEVWPRESYVPYHHVTSGFGRIEAKIDKAIEYARSNEEDFEEGDFDCDEFSRTRYYVESMLKTVKLTMPGPHKKELREALEVLVPVFTVTDANLACSKVATDILMKADHYTDALRKDKPKRRVDKIIRHYSAKHAQMCHDVYPTELAKTLEQSDRQLVERVDSFAELDGIGPFVSVDRGVYDKLVALVKGDPDAKYMRKDENGQVDEEKLRALCTKYIAAPCAHYTGKVQDIFDSYEFDQKSYPGAKAPQEFLAAMKRNQYCSDYVRYYQQQFLDELKDFIKFTLE